MSTAEPLLDVSLSQRQAAGRVAALPMGLFERLSQLNVEDVPARIGPYRVTGLIGRGGMGVVYDALDEHLGRRVAVKVMAAFAAPNAKERFRREARTAAKLRHDNLVPVFAAETPDDGPPFLVMPFIDGPTLLEEIAAKRGLDPKAAATIVREIADGLSAVHAAGVVHRDVKPGNILLDRVDGRAKLTDFGLARGDETTLASAGHIAGTPNYLSPEQVATPDHVDARADVYALGATLYECLAAVPPFTGPTLEILKRIGDADPLPPRTLQPTTPRELETIALKCLEKDPARRYQTAQDVRDDLDRWLQGKPIFAKPCGLPTTVWKWVKRNRAVAALLTLLAVAITGGFAVSLVQWQRAVAKQHEAEKNLDAALGVVDRFCTRVSEEELFNKPGLQPVRAKLLKDAVEHYRAFVASRRDDPTARADVAKALTRLAHVSLELGDIDAADLIRDAIAQHELLSAGPLVLGQDYLDLADACIRRRDFAGTIDAASQAITLLESVPPTFETQRHIATARVHRATAECQGRHGNGQTDFAAATAILDTLMKERPDDISLRQQLANTLTVEVSMRMTVADIPILERARDLKRAVLAAKPDSDEARSSLAQTEINLGVLYKWAKRDDEAVSTYSHAADILATLVAENPKVVGWRRNLARTRFNLGMIHLARGQTPDAAMAFRDARDHFAKVPRDTSVQIDLASASVRVLQTTGDDLVGTQQQVESLIAAAEDHNVQRSRINSLVDHFATAARSVHQPQAANRMIIRRSEDLLRRGDTDDKLREWLTFVIEDAIAHDLEPLPEVLHVWLMKRPQDTAIVEKLIAEYEPGICGMIPQNR